MDQFTSCQKRDTSLFASATNSKQTSPVYKYTCSQVQVNGYYPTNLKQCLFCQRIAMLLFRQVQNYSSTYQLVQATYASIFFYYLVRALMLWYLSGCYISRSMQSKFSSQYPRIMLILASLFFSTHPCDIYLAGIFLPSTIV